MKAAVLALVFFGAGAAKCSDDDKKIISAMPGGHDAGSFPALCAQAGKDSYSIWSGLDENHFEQEFNDKIKVSKTCASCYADAAKYGADNCKSKCIFSWCSQGCLDCSRNQVDKVNACAGFTAPQPTTCNYGNAAEVTVVVGASAAKCSDDDKKIISAMPGGHDAGSFPALCAQAGKDSYSIWSGFDENHFEQEFNDKIKVSKTCASCYADAAKYGADNCKSKCIFSWCSQGCLDCSRNQVDKVNACAGFTAPQPTTCNYGDATEVTV